MLEFEGIVEELLPNANFRVKLIANDHVIIAHTAGNTMSFVGPDPDAGNAIMGLSLGAATDTWHVGVHYDWIRGDNGSTTQVGMITVLGRI